MRLFLIIPLLFCALLSGTPFEWKAVPDGGRLTVTVKVESGYYFHADTFLLEVSGNIQQPPKILSSPVPQKISDPDRGQVEVFPAGTWTWVYQGIPPFRVSVSFQGCKIAGKDEPALCLMPETLQLLPVNTPLKAAEEAAVRDFYSSWRVVRSRTGSMSESEMVAFLTSGDSFGADRSSMGIVFVMLLALLGGIGLNLTPCVLPMIPINLAIIGARESKTAGFRRGALYGLGMALAYGILGVIVVLTGSGFGALNSTSWFNFGIGALFLILSCAMFGFFNFDLSRYRIAPGRLNAGRDFGAFLMGGIAALLAGACVAPVVATVLMVAAKLYAEGVNAALFLGFLLGIGMGLPWPLAGAGLSILPKPGRFMVIVKQIFAVVILLLGVYYCVLGWSLLPGKSDPAAELSKLEAAARRARAGKKLLCIEFHASWCKNCKAMERTVMKTTAVQQALQRFIFVPFQAENPGDPLIAPLLKLWKVPGFPAFVIVDPGEK